MVSSPMNLILFCVVRSFWKEKLKPIPCHLSSTCQVIEVWHYIYSSSTLRNHYHICSLFGLPNLKLGLNNSCMSWMVYIFMVTFLEPRNPRLTLTKFDWSESMWFQHIFFILRSWNWVGSEANFKMQLHESDSISVIFNHN